MAWGWIFRKLASGSPVMGLFGYLTSRDQNKTRIKLEKTRQQSTKDIIDHLPSGAVYREGTPDGWREILMPPGGQSSLFVVPLEQRGPTNPVPSIELPQPPRALSQPDEETPQLRFRQSHQQRELRTVSTARAGSKTLSSSLTCGLPVGPTGSMRPARTHGSA